MKKTKIQTIILKNLILSQLNKLKYYSMFIKFIIKINQIEI